MDIAVWVADIGSIKQKNFGWCRAIRNQTEDISTCLGTDIGEFVEGIAKDLSAGDKVAVGFECPLYIPIAEYPINLTNGRKVDGDRAWSAGAGPTVLVTGLAECVWIFLRLKELSLASITPTIDWETFRCNQANLYVWEAFVTGKAKAATHDKDAEIAARTFWSAYPNIQQEYKEIQQSYSMIGAALLRAGLSKDIELLSKACTVLKS